jgi:uncharacterized protein YbbC (DUF1343 family)
MSKIKLIGWSSVVLLAVGVGSVAAQETEAEVGVKLGVDVLTERGFQPLAGKRIGLITNPTGVNRELRSTVDILYNAPGVELVALFGPEHGVRGEIPAGEKITDATDAATGLPVRSLYGATRKPTAAMLSDIDVLVFDIQDIGSRSYTYISTMAAAMEAAAEHGKAFVVLDRPNPLGGEKIEGRVLDMEYKSFVGYLPIPYLHGMTVGELAHMINEEGWLGDGRKCDLQVIEMEGWKRDMQWADTGLRWVPTSPHVPHANTAAYYACTGIMGELRVMSEGVGYPLPFELAGHPDIDPTRLAEDLNRRDLAGVYFRPMYFQPYYGPYAKETVAGVQIYLSDMARAELTAIQFHIMDAVRQHYPEIAFFAKNRNAMFDKVCGTDRIRKLFKDERALPAILNYWREGVEEFRKARAKYLLYH